MSEPTPAQQEQIVLLRSVLPGIQTIAGVAGVVGVDGARSVFASYSLDERVIDCEWDEDGDKKLTTIGIGNDRCILQIAWRELDDYAKAEIRADIEALVKTGVTIYHAADADIRKLRETGFNLTPAGHARLEDTMLADAVLHSEEAHDLGDLNWRHGRLPEWKSLKHVAPDVYNAGDVAGTYVIWKHGIAPALDADPAANFVYRTMSIPFLAIQIEGEEAGVRVNAPVAYELLGKYGTRVEQARLLALAVTGDSTFNLGSPDQMKHWLYNVYGLPVQREKSFNNAGKVVSDKDAVATLRRHHGTEWDESDEPTLEQALVNVDDGGHGLLEAKVLFSGAQQRLTHYVEPCFEDGSPRARIYPELRQHVQATGRHSYVGPALQQMKGDTAGLITPDVGTVWVAWDWSQIEVRLLAALADDVPYLDAFARGDDIHGLNVRAIFGPVGSKELEELRRGFVKRFVFRLHYRGKAENAGDIPGARALGLNADGLVSASESYLAKHPAIPLYWTALEAQAERYRVVYTFMGRPRRLTSDYRNARNREACNHPMQGGVSDVYVTTALLVKSAAPWARLVFGAHDAQTWQVPAARAVEFVTIAAPIVNRSFVINGREVVFPAEFKPPKEAV